MREIAAQVARELRIDAEFDGADVQGDTLVISYSQAQQSVDTALKVSAPTPITAGRQRTKRKGWDVVARIENRKGQRVAIYQPLLDAVHQGGTPDAQRDRIRAVLRENGNNPTEASVNYYFANTRDYLEQQEAVRQ